MSSVGPRYYVNADPSVCSKTSCLQIFYGLWVNLAEIGIGMAVGWSAVAVPQFEEIGFDATKDQLAWIASILTLFSPLGCLACGLLIDRIGRRMMQIISQLPMALGWWYTALSTNATHLMIGRVITGIGVGMSAGPIRIYTNEISLPNMRGVLGAFPNIAISMGITATAAMGAVLKWTTHCYICGLYAFLLMVLNYFLPETPYHVLVRDSTEDFEHTREALKKFRSRRYVISHEMEQIIEYKKENEIRRLPLGKKIKALFHISACKPFFTVIPYIIAGQLSGISIMMFWTIDILESSNIGLDLHLCNIALGVTRIFSGVFTSILMYYFGRRPLALASDSHLEIHSSALVHAAKDRRVQWGSLCPAVVVSLQGLGVSLVCLSVGGYLLNASSPAWYPQVGYMFYMLFASLGYYTLPLLIMYELYPLLIRGLLGGITVSIANLLIFSSNRLYPYVKNSIGLARTVIIFGLFSLLGTIFLYLCLPETKELTLQEIEEYYNNKRSTLVSQRRVYSAQWQKKSLQIVHSSSSDFKGKSLEHHKASNPPSNAYSGRKLSLVSKEINLHRSDQPTPLIRAESHSTEDALKSQQTKGEADQQKRDSVHSQDRATIYASFKGVGANTRNKRASVIKDRSTTDNSPAASGRATINPFAATTSTEASGRSNIEGSKEGSDESANRAQTPKIAQSSNDSNIDKDEEQKEKLKKKVKEEEKKNKESKDRK